MFPACAGVRAVRTAVRTAGEDVPRVCGGEPHLLELLGLHEECSPRVRG